MAGAAGDDERREARSEAATIFSLQPHVRMAQMQTAEPLVLAALEVLTADRLVGTIQPQDDDGERPVIEAPALDVKGQRFNCSNNTNVSNGEIVDAFANIWGCEAVQSETEQWALAGKTCYQDCSKAKRVLGWEPKHKSVLDELAEIIPAMYGDDPELRVTFH